MSSALLNTPLISGLAGADLTGKEGYFVKPSSTANTWVLAGAGEFGLPLALGASSGRAISIYAPGSVAKMKAGSAINAGVAVKSLADGRADDAAATAVAGAAVTGSNVNGFCLRGCSNANEIIEVLVNPLGALVTTAS